VMTSKIQQKTVDIPGTAARAEQTNCAWEASSAPAQRQSEIRDRSEMRWSMARSGGGGGGGGEGGGGGGGGGGGM
jgi:hypothetical protein